MARIDPADPGRGAGTAAATIEQRLAGRSALPRGSGDAQPHRGDAQRLRVAQKRRGFRGEHRRDDPAHDDQGGLKRRHAQSHAQALSGADAAASWAFPDFRASPQLHARSSGEGLRRRLRRGAAHADERGHLASRQARAWRPFCHHADGGPARALPAGGRGLRLDAYARPQPGGDDRRDDGRAGRLVRVSARADEQLPRARHQSLTPGVGATLDVFSRTILCACALREAADLGVPTGGVE